MKPVKLNMTWRGRRPMIGCFLKTPRGRTAYEIVGIRPGVIRSFTPGLYFLRTTAMAARLRRALGDRFRVLQKGRLQRAEPHGWRRPRAVRVVIAIIEATR